MTPLLLSAAYGHLACTEVLCAAGANVDQVNAWGSTALIKASEKGRTETAGLLLEHKADVNQAMNVRSRVARRPRLRGARARGAVRGEARRDRLC